VAEQSTEPHAERLTPGVTVARGVLNLAPSISGLASGIALLDICGRKLLDLTAGENDVSRLAPGVYFVTELGPGTRGRGPGEKVVIAR
jgi:hypothetical protein